MRQSVDKADGVSQKDLPRAEKFHTAGGGIQRGKQPILRQNTRFCQMVEQSGLACVGITRNGDLRDTARGSGLAAQGTGLGKLRKLFLQCGNFSPHVTSVSLKLGFTRSAGADAAAETGKFDALARQARYVILKLCDLDLQHALARNGVFGEDVQDEHGAVNDTNITRDRVFNVLDLARSEVGIKHDHRDLLRVAKLGEFLEFARTDAGCGNGALQCLRKCGDYRKACRIAKALQLKKSTFQVVLRHVPFQNAD